MKSAVVFYLVVGVGLGLVGGLLYWLESLGAVHWLAAANAWLADNVIERLGYAGVFALMFIESSFIPFPSEIVVPPAGHLARNAPGWQLGWVIVAALAGSLGGGLFNYGLARLLGRPAILGLIRRYGGYVRLSPEAYLRAEGFFLRHGEISTLTGRLIPGIRQIISLPAGLARMNLLAFSLYTSLGAGAWVVVLALVGYWFGSEPEALSKAMGRYSLWFIVAAVVLLAGYVVTARRRAARPPG